MDRRGFLQNIAAAAAAVKTSLPIAAASQAMAHTTRGSTPVDVDGHTLICELEQQGGERWTVYEDLRSREGALTFLSSSGAARVMTKSAAPRRRVTVNGRPATVDGSHRDTVVIQTGADRRFEIVGR